MHPNSIDITGKRFGRLIALSATNKRTKGRDVYWRCQCECGISKEIIGYSLRSGNTKSCGCLRIEKISKAPGQSVFNKIYWSYKRSAQNRNLDFDLSANIFSKITSLNCYYCGAPPRKKSISGLNGSCLLNGIDRIDNNVGYLKDNCVPCCSTCNQMKWTMTKEDFISHISRIYKYNE